MIPEVATLQQLGCVFFLLLFRRYSVKITNAQERQLSHKRAVILYEHVADVAILKLQAVGKVSA